MELEIWKFGLLFSLQHLRNLFGASTRLLMAVALSTLKITSPMLTICIDIIRGRQQITNYLYPFFVPILVYALSVQASTDYGTH